ncbi:hypothetical protein [Corallococcus llansteffanensis]|uniref:hypothetical protein n=1 Tax=Corallococcus llansteffanensis TaxID=2316731 RepID=UPI001ABF4460|nr:hypothetical protein [Corallococcus llansteffanensis]
MTSGVVVHHPHVNLEDAERGAPTGPFETLAQATGAPDSAVLRRSEAWIGPGYNSVFTDRAGQDWSAYHAIDVRRPYAEAVIGKDCLVRRPMLTDRLTWKDGWPHVEGGMPSAGPVAAPSVLRK